MTPIQVGDIVVYSRKFLQSTGYYQVGSAEVISFAGTEKPRVAVLKPLPAAKGVTPLSDRVLETNLIRKDERHKERF